jgi:hypothetical protein
MCHLTGFTKKCSALVGSRKCERWKILTIEQPGGVVEQRGDCIDDWMFYFGIANERGLTQITASTDQLRNNVAQAHTESMATVLRHMLSKPEIDRKMIEG